MRGKGNDRISINDGDHLSLEGRGSHDSACTGQGWDQACSSKSKDRGAPIIMGKSDEVGGADECSVPDQAGILERGRS